MAKHTNYELFEELGRGEDSVVNRAWDLALSRDVAIKQLAAEPESAGGPADRQRIDQFLGEASFLAQFEHENVLRIHTVDQERGWIVMELMKGSLSSQIAGEPMKPDAVRSVMRQMLGALDFLHQKAKVHGSVRPSNILINDQGTVKLSDFEASSRDSELRVPNGSKKYLAPELIRSDFGDFGPALDLYCLGFTALELLTGKKFDSLFPGTGEGAIDADVAWLRWHSSDDAMKPVKEIAPKIPDDLARVIDKLLLKPVDQRPQTAAEVLNLLDDVPLVPIEVTEPLVKAAKQQDVAAILPSKTVKLRADSAKNRTDKKRNGVTKTKRKKNGSKNSQNNSLNEILEKPFVLWPIVAAMLIGALFIGLHLRSNRAKPIAEGNPVAKIKDERLDITLNVLPDTSNAKLLVSGEPHDFEELKLKPGSYPFVVEKNGFEKYTALLEIGEGKTTFDIVLKETPVKVVVNPEKNGPDLVNPVPVQPKEPKFIDIQIAVFPSDAELLMDGKRINLNNGILRLNPNEIEHLRLAAKADGFEPLSSRWSMDELEAKNYSLQLSLNKLPAQKTAAFTLPSSLVPKPDTAYDELTGLPVRAFVQLLQNTAPLQLALVTPGSYQFGVADGKLRSWELEAKTVEIKQPFYIGVDEVNNAQYQAFVSETVKEKSKKDSQASDPDLPVVNLSVRQAAEFCDWTGGRLPTETEWEAAVRGPQDSGFPLPWSFGATTRNLDAQRCKLFRGESKENSGPVKVRALPEGANRIGLLNTIGNVAEWCDNPQGADQFVIKGCSFRIPPGDHVRVTWRNRSQWAGAPDIGMRLLVPVVEEQQTSPALTFVAPTDINTLVSTGVADQDGQSKNVYVKTTAEIASEFTGPAELVIDSGGFMNEIADIGFSPDGKRVAVAGGKIVRIWDVESGDLFQTIRGDMSRTSYGNANSVAWSPDGKHLLVGVSDYRAHGNIRVYSTDNFDEISEVLTGHNAPCRKTCFSRDGKQLVSVDADGLILVRDWQSRKIQHRIPARNPDKPIFDLMKFPTDKPYMLAVDFEGPQVFSAVNGQRISAKGNMPSRIRGWMVDVFNNLAKLPYNVKAQPRVMDFRMEEGRWAGSGNAVVDGRSKFWIRVWQSRDPVSSPALATELAAYDKHRWNITALSLQPNGSLVASGDKFGEVHVWDSATGKQKFKFAGQGKPIYEVAFDKESSRLAFGTRPHSPENWKANDHGTATRVLDLKQRAIVDVASRKDLALLKEQPALGGANVKLRRVEANYFVERLLGTQLKSKYRISSGRIPTAFTLLDKPKLGVEQPVVFGDDEGLLALWDSAGDELKRAFIGHGSLVSAISASSNGKLIATSSTDRTIRLWSIEDYVPTGIFDFKFENSAVLKVVPGTSSARAGVRIGDRIVSIDGKSLTEMFELMLLGKFEYKPGQVVPVKMKRGEEGFEYEMEMANGYDFSEPVLNFYMGDNGQWIIWHPQGYYDASPGADRLIGWHLNRGYDKSAQFFEVQQFRKKLYRPDIIDGILKTGSLELAMKELKGAKKDDQAVDFREPKTLAQYHPPTVRITYPTDTWQTESAKVTVKGEANAVNELPITAVTLLHNGHVAKVFRPSGVNQLAMSIEHEIELEPGKNDLVLIAANAKSSSQGKHIVVALNQRARSQRQDALVLAIGVSEFDENFDALPQASKDAKAFAASMKSHENGKLYGSVETKLLSGSVSEDEVLEGFQWLADNAKDGDVVMVFVASHGIVDRRDNFFIGTTNSIETKARSTAVSWRDLMDTLQLDLPDCKRMVFLDLQPTKNSIKPGSRNPLLDLAAPEMGTIFLSSNTLQQETLRLNGSGNGTFLNAVLETVGDQKFDTNPSGDSLFNPVELAAGVTSRVKAMTNDQQQPVFFSPEFAKFANVLELQN